MFNNSQRGVSLIITFFIMIIILAVVLSISALLYSEVKVIRNIGNSIISLYAADSGIEKVLYYDRQVLENGAKRGLCSMFDSIGNSSKYCGNMVGYDPSIYCLNVSAADSAGGTGCDINTCTNCTISFNTNFGNDDKRTYYTTAKVYPDVDGKSFDLEINSRGAFGTAERQIQILENTRNVCSSAYQVGDLNKNGVVNIDDYTIFTNARGGIATFNLYNYPCLDVNNDGTFDTNDQRIIIDYNCFALNCGYWPKL